MESHTPAAKPLSLQANTPIADWVIRSFWFLKACLVVGLFVQFAEIDMLERGIVGKGISAGEIAENEKRTIIFFSASVFGFLLSGILFLVWFYKTYRNMHRAGFLLRYRPAMAVWGFIIPVASFVMPYLIAREIAAKTAMRLAQQDTGYRPRASKYVVLMWWILYWLAGIVGIYSSLLGLTAETAETLIEAKSADLWYFSLTIAAIIATNSTARRLADDERELLKTWNEVEVKNKEMAKSKYVPDSVTLIDSHLHNFVTSEEVLVLHKIESEVIHSDIYVIKANEYRPYHLLLTCGLSALPMTVPEGFEDVSYAEITMLLPPDWKLQHEEFEDEKNYWPIRTLKELSKNPHFNDTWLGYGHTYPLDTEDGTDHGFAAVILLNSRTLPDDFTRIDAGDKVVYLYAAIPLYREELAFKMEHGTVKLLERFTEFNVPEVIDVNRINVCANRG